MQILQQDKSVNRPVVGLFSGCVVANVLTPAGEITYNSGMRYLLIFLLLFSLTACGFHLRGSVELPPSLTEMAVQDASPATDIALELRRALKAKGIHVSAVAPLTLQLKAEQYGKRVLSVDSAGRAQEYGLSYTVKFVLQGEGGALWLADQSVTETRDLRFDANAVLGTASEEVQLKAEMRRDAIFQIMRRLQRAQAPSGAAADAEGKAKGGAK